MCYQQDLPGVPHQLRGLHGAWSQPVQLLLRHTEHFLHFYRKIFKKIMFLCIFKFKYCIGDPAAPQSSLSECWSGWILHILWTCIQCCDLRAGNFCRSPEVVIKMDRLRPKNVQSTILLPHFPIFMFWRQRWSETVECIVASRIRQFDVFLWEVF